MSLSLPALPISRRRFLAAGVAIAATSLIATRPAWGALRPRGIVHPDPRPGITGDVVLDPARFASRPKVRRLYEMAREAPQIFDGLGCYCRCSEEHRSLLACFESEQPTGCGGCQEEAREAHRLWKGGKSLTEIRQALDEKWG